MNIYIETIPHGRHRYETVGDWWFDAGGNLQIRVSEMGDWRHEALVGLHEAAEALLCKERGISEEAVTAFDKAFDGEGEPGDSPAAPYGREHRFATRLEYSLAAEMGVDWDAYEKAVEAL